VQKTIVKCKKHRPEDYYAKYLIYYMVNLSKLILGPGLDIQILYVDIDGCGQGPLFL